MITIENVNVYGWESAIRGMRNPMNSWDKSDSGWCFNKNRNESKCDALCCDNCVSPFYEVGNNDLKLMRSLSKAGNDHAKFLRMINVTCDITAPLYWWKEFDTYKVGTVRNSCSTMHKIHEKEFTLDDFSHEHLKDFDGFKDELTGSPAIGWFKLCMESNIDYLNFARKLYCQTGDKQYWWQMIQLLPSSYNQRGTVQMNYQVLENIYKSRKGHRLDEWQTFREWCETLPYFIEICGE